MLPEGTSKCPVCGTKLGGDDEEEALTRKEYLVINLYVLGIILGPIIIALLLGIICVAVWH
jgi:hypothetical protein